MQQERVLGAAGREQLDREQQLLADRVQRVQLELKRERDELQLEQQRTSSQLQLERQMLVEERTRYDADRRLGTDQMHKSYVQIKQLELEMQQRIQA